MNKLFLIFLAFLVLFGITFAVANSYENENDESVAVMTYYDWDDEECEGTEPPAGLCDRNGKKDCTQDKRACEWVCLCRGGSCTWELPMVCPSGVCDDTTCKSEPQIESMIFDK